MIMVAVMYGPKPSMAIERLSKAPPENIFKNPKSWLPDKKLFRASAFTPGMGIAAKTLKQTKMKAITRTLFLNSFILKMFNTLSSIFYQLTFSPFGFIIKTAQFRQSLNQVAFGWPNAVAGSRLLSFGAMAGGGAAFTATTDALPFFIAVIWFKFVQLHITWMLLTSLKREWSLWRNSTYW